VWSKSDTQSVTFGCTATVQSSIPMANSGQFAPARRA
jgi:hypothetical protein